MTTRRRSRPGLYPRPTRVGKGLPPPPRLLTVVVLQPAKNWSRHPCSSRRSATTSQASAHRANPEQANNGAAVHLSGGEGQAPCGGGAAGGHRRRPVVARRRRTE